MGMTSLRIETTGGIQVRSNRPVHLTPGMVRKIAGLKEFSEDAIARMCDWRGDHYLPAGLVFSCPAGRTLMISRSQDGKFARRWDMPNGSCTVHNLTPGSRFYCQAEDEKGEPVSPLRSFVTAEDLPGTVYIPGVDNTRDLGGWLTEDGKRIRRGVAYRGANLRDLTPEGAKVMTRDLDIRTELDLSGGSESSPLLDDVVAKEFWPIRWYQLIFQMPDFLPNLKEALLLFADDRYLPVYYHCSVGRDRTGAVSLFLLGLCGCSWETVMRDHFTTFFSRKGDAENAGIPAHMNNVILMRRELEKYAGPAGTLREMVENFLMSIGMTKEDFERIRENLLEER